jgi:hypothetical protein
MVPGIAGGIHSISFLCMYYIGDFGLSTEAQGLFNDDG